MVEVRSFPGWWVYQLRKLGIRVQIIEQGKEIKRHGKK